MARMAHQQQTLRVEMTRDELIDYHCASWAEMYARDIWTLEQLEAHVEAMLPAAYEQAEELCDRPTFSRLCGLR